MAVGVLDGVQVLDEPVAAAQLRRLALVAQQHAQGGQGHRRQFTAAGLAAKAALRRGGRFGHGGLLRVWAGGALGFPGLAPSARLVD